MRKDEINKISANIKLTKKYLIGKLKLFLRMAQKKQLIILKKKMKKKQNNLVSVIINCHNGEKFVERCINSVLKQSYKKI